MKKNNTFLFLFLTIIAILVILLPSISSRKNGTETEGQKVEQHNRELEAKKAAEKEAKEKEEERLREEAEKEAAKQPVSLIFTGDVSLSVKIQANYKASGVSGTLDPLMLSKLNAADILAINNEFAFSTRGTAMANKEYTYRVDPSFISLYKEMGVDCAGLANNHALDFGDDALLDTLDTLKGADIKTCGAGNSYDEAASPAVFEKNGKTFAILAASRVIPVEAWNIDSHKPGMLATYNPDELINEIKKAKSAYDYVFVMVHWGVMYEDYPQDYQVNFAKKYIDAGADAVFGAHPHVLQGIEYYNGKPVFYSLGNFMFFPNTDKTCAVEVTVTDQGITYRILPAYAKDSRTCLAEGADAERVYGHLKKISSGVEISSEGMVTPVQ